MDAVAQSEHSESNRHQSQVDVSGSRHQEWNAAFNISRSGHFLGALALLLNEFGRRCTLGVMAEVISGRERIFITELLVDGLRDSICGKQLSAGAIGAGRKASGEEQNQPIPVEDLRPNNKGKNRPA